VLMPCIVFDALGSLLTFAGISQEMAQRWPQLPASAVQSIVHESLRDYVCAGCVDQYIPLSRFLLHSTSRYLRRHGITASGQEARMVVDAVADGRMHVVAGGQEALADLQAAGWTPAIVTNGSRGAVEKALARAGLLTAFDGGKAIVSCEELGYGKPRREVYQGIQDHLQAHHYLAEDEEWILCSCHAWDVFGANHSQTRAVGVFAKDAGDEAEWQEAYERPVLLGENFYNSVQMVIQRGVEG